MVNYEITNVYPKCRVEVDAELFTNVKVLLMCTVHNSNTDSLRPVCSEKKFRVKPIHTIVDKSVLDKASPPHAKAHTTTPPVKTALR